MSLTQDIKEYALDLGCSRVGITTADGFPEYIEDLQSRPKFQGTLVLKQLDKSH